MTDEGMSSEDYEVARSKLYDHVRGQLLLMAKLPYKKRKTLIAHQVRCTDCEDVVTQVVWVNLQDGKLARAIRWREPEHEGPPMPVDTDPRERARVMANRKPSYRPGEWWFCVVTAEPQVDPSLYSTCECGRHRWNEAELLSRTGHDSTSKPTQLPFA